MSAVTVGQQAPSFRLPSAQGTEVGLEDYRGRKNVILMFAKGMACGFCRQSMSQLGRGYPRFRELDTEILLVSPTTPERGRFYARNFQLPFLYLCDPDYAAYGAYGLTIRPHSLAWKAVALVNGMRSPKPKTEFGEIRPAISEMGGLVNDDDLGFFIVDKAGIIHYARAGTYVLMEGGRLVGARPIPSNDEIARELERCQPGPAAARQASA